MNFRCRFTNNFSCLLAKSYSFMMKIWLGPWNSHFTRTTSPKLTPPAKTAQIENGRFFNKDSPIFFRQKFTFVTSINHGKLYKISSTNIFQTQDLRFFDLDFCCLTIFASSAKNHLFLLSGACQMARMTQNTLGIHLGTWNSHPRKPYNKCSKM